MSHCRDGAYNPSRQLNDLALGSINSGQTINFDFLNQQTGQFSFFGANYGATGLSEVPSLFGYQSGNRNDGVQMPGWLIGGAPDQMYKDVGDVYKHPSMHFGAHGSIVTWPSDIASAQNSILALKFYIPPSNPKYVSFSGGPEHNVPPFFGRLMGDIYRPSDLLDSKDYKNEWVGDVYAPVGVSVDEFTRRLIDATANYNNGNQVNYNVIPELTGNYNSGSYFRSAAEASGGIIWPPEIIDGWPFVGASKLIDRSHFTNGAP